MPTLYRKCIDFLKTFPPYFRHFYGFFNRVNRFDCLFPFAFFFLFAWRHLLLESLVFSMFTFFYSLPLCLRWYFMHLVHTLIELNVHGMVLSLNFVTIFWRMKKIGHAKWRNWAKSIPYILKIALNKNIEKSSSFLSKSWQRQKLAC